MSKTLTLRRSYLEAGCLSAISADGKEICKAVERPYKNNAKNISAVPAGVYNISLYNSNKHGNCFILTNDNLHITKFDEQNCTRFGILIHPANYPEQLEGCIAPGLTFHNKKYGVVSSRLAMKRLGAIIKDNSYTIEII